MSSEERTKKIGKFFILFSGIVKDVWTKCGTKRQPYYEVSVHLKKKGVLIERGDFSDRNSALNTYRGLKRVSDVHKFLNALNPTDRPLRHSDGRLRY